MTTRRDFLTGTLAVAAAAALPVVAMAGGDDAITTHWSQPILFGDGVHDDGPAIRAMLRGEPVIHKGDVILSVLQKGDVAMIERGVARLPEGEFYFKGKLSAPSVQICCTPTTRFRFEP